MFQSFNSLYLFHIVVFLEIGMRKAAANAGIAAALFFIETLS